MTQAHESALVDPTVRTWLEQTAQSGGRVVPTNDGALLVEGVVFTEAWPQILANITLKSCKLAAGGKYFGVTFIGCSLPAQKAGVLRLLHV